MGSVQVTFLLSGKNEKEKEKKAKLMYSFFYHNWSHLIAFSHRPESLD